MATQTITTSGDIPKILSPFYEGRPGEGTVGTPGYKAPITGLLERGISAIYPDDLTGAEAYARQFAPLIEQGLIGAGTVAPMSQFQQALGTQLAGMTLPGQYQLAEQAGQAGAAGLQALMGLQAERVAAPELQMYQMSPAERVAAQSATTRDIQAAQTGYRPLLQSYEIGMPETFGAEQAQQYMSPYMQNVVDIQQRQAIDAARQSQLGGNLAAARQGTYGGARQALLQAQRESGLRTQLGDIQAQGLQGAFQQAQQQFGADRAAQMEAQRLNQQAALGVQQLGTQTGLQTSLANLTNEQQARVQNEANRLQAQGMNQESALRAALANQQAGLTVGQQNLAAQLGVQQLGATQALEAQRLNQAAGLQAGQTRLAAAQGLGGLASTFGGLGTQQLAGELDVLKTQGAFGDLQRSISQQQMDAQRQALQDQAQYGQTQVGQLSNLLRGIPLSDTTQQNTTPPPSFASQLTGLGLSGIGLYNLLGGG